MNEKLTALDPNSLDTFTLAYVFTMLMSIACEPGLPYPILVTKACSSSPLVIIISLAMCKRDMRDNILFSSLQWVSLDATKPVVVWGSDPKQLTNTKVANSSTYNASDMCGSPATDFGYRDPGLLHQVTMDGYVCVCVCMCVCVCVHVYSYR